MRIVVAGATGRAGALVTSRLSESGHEVVGLVRSDGSARAAAGLGATPTHDDIDGATAQDAARVLVGADVAVFTAGAAGYTNDDFRRIDRDGLIVFAQGAIQAGVRRLVVMSSMSAGEPERLPAEAYYMQMKGEADDFVIAQPELEWQIVRPGFLVDEDPTGRVSVGRRQAPKEITRAEVATVLQYLIEHPEAKKNELFEVINADAPIGEALGP